MPRYRITMINNGIGTIVVFVDKPNPKVAYDDAVAGAAQIFGVPEPDKLYSVIVVEEPV
jgi:hypothetical protein